MAELQFAKTFLSVLDSRPVKVSADHVEDPKGYPARSAYTLPKMPKPMSKPGAHSTAPGSERSITVTVKSLRNPPLDIKLMSQTPNTSALDIKTSVADQTGIPADKIKLLYKKKPTPDSKVLKDLAGAEETAIEFSVMIMGGAAAAVKTPAPNDVAQGPSGEEVVNSAEFWDDLRGYLLQRIRNEEKADEVFGIFQTAWKARS